MAKTVAMMAKIVAERVVSGPLQESIQLGIASHFLPETLSVCLAKRIDSRIAALPIYCAVYVTMALV